MPTSALQVARTGLEAQDSRMRVIANNLANVGTTGFKRDRANFATLAYQDARVAGQRSSGETAYATGLNLGTGVAVQSTSQIMTQGTLNTTSNAFDLALDGDGYFQIEMPGGRTAYTRAGDFTLSAEGQPVTQQGYAVQPAITVPEGSTAISVSPDGIVSATLAGEGEPVELGQIQIARFTNPAGLQAIGDNFLVGTGASGAAELGPGGEAGRGNIRQGMLEGSNVNIVEELVEMIECQRAYEISSKMVSAYVRRLRRCRCAPGRVRSGPAAAARAAFLCRIGRRGDLQCERGICAALLRQSRIARRRSDHRGSRRTHSDQQIHERQHAARRQRQPGPARLRAHRPRRS